MNQKRVERLEKTLARVARERGLDQERLRCWVSFLALYVLLERAVSQAKLNMMREALAQLDRRANEHGKIFGTPKPN